MSLQESSVPETQVLLADLVVGESPRWHENRLWFCHWREHEVIAVDVDGNSEVVTRDPASSPHSIEWLPDGRQLVVPGSAESKPVEPPRVR